MEDETQRQQAQAARMAQLEKDKPWLKNPLAGQENGQLRQENGQHGQENGQAGQNGQLGQENGQPRQENGQPGQQNGQPGQRNGQLGQRNSQPVPVPQPVPALPPQPVPGESSGRIPPARRGKPAAAFGEDNTKFLWYPYLPMGDYSVLMAAGGVGKTMAACAIAAAVSAGKPLPGEEFGREPGQVLFISAEDRGEVLKKRLSRCGADLMKVFILDCADSVGMNFTDRYDEFRGTVLGHLPSLVVVDPWHGFLGEGVNIDRVNVMRPVLQKLSLLAKEADCAMLLISHVNKRAQGENANNAAQGSADFINASRSAMQAIFDEEKDCRLLVHTKSNYGPYGQSVRYRIERGGVVWDGFSDVSRETLEAAARRRTTPWEMLERDQTRSAAGAALMEALKESASQFQPTRFTYEEFKEKYGELIFGGQQPKRAMDEVKDALLEAGYYLKTGIQVRRGMTKGNGFLIQRIDQAEPEQTKLCT